MLDRREMICALGGTVLTLPFAPACAAQVEQVFRPEDFGAKGDGTSNDTLAFRALAERVNRAGGGTVEFRRGATYIVGMQRRATGSGRAFDHIPLLEFSRCTRPLLIRGNGSTIRCAPGLRYGSFDPRTAQPSRRPLPYYDRNEVAMPYGWMILAVDCSGPVEITDFELDGNLRGHQIGGLWGDGGRQIHAYGIGLYNNRGSELVRNVYTHHHALDGMIVDGLDAARSARTRIENVRSEYNARQGCSVVGGRGIDFVNCRFAHTGKAGLVSAPGSGVDIEAEDKRVRDLTFADCEFIDNAGPSLLADSGDSEGAVFRRCTFVGTTSWSAWPKKPGFRFHDSTFVGAIVNAFTDLARPDRSTKFYNCTFRDDPALSPTREVYRGHADTIAELGSHPHVLFSGCAFRLTHRATLPWTNSVVYENCTMAQRSSVGAFPRGRYVGRNSITAPAPIELSGSAIEGELTVNGRRIPRGRFG